MYLLSPKFWYGAEPWALARMMSRRGISVSPSRVPALLLGAYFSLVNGGLAIVSHLAFARQISNVQFVSPPIFVLGHWRSGTTWLHQLLTTDDRMVAPNGYQCFVPGHFLLSESILRPLLELVLPKRRPMDGMTLNLTDAQEDEYAVFNRLGCSTYSDFVAPAEDGSESAYLGLSGLSHDEKEDWLSTWTWFLKSVMLRSGEHRRLVLKTPQHTARIGSILKVFPDAKFVHIAREPGTVFASTCRTWEAMARSHCLKTPDADDIRTHSTIRRNFDGMYESYRRDVDLIPPANLMEIRYEDLVADPMGELCGIYDTFGLCGFESVRVRLAQKLATAKSYQAQTRRPPELAPALRKSAMLAWYRERFGYVAS